MPIVVPVATGEPHPRTLPAVAPRYHSLDALRAVMMLLGIWLHVVVAYSRYGGWPWKDGATTEAFDWTLGLIHTFRMPAFYVMAGFFSALLVARRGGAGFARNRAVRILVPFVVGWLVLYPLVAALRIWAGHLGQAGIPRLIFDFFTSGAVFRGLHPMHLWFLEYLVFFYLIALAVRPVAARWPGLLEFADHLFRRVFTSRWRAAILGSITFLTFCLMSRGWLDDPRGFAPEPKILLAYLVFYGVGWWLYRQADLLSVLRSGSSPYGSLGLGALTWLVSEVCNLSRERLTGHLDTLAFFGCAWFHGVAAWLLICGVTGWFLRFCEQPSSRFRYVADSSYWLYLAHMPVIMVFQIAVARTGWPPIAKLFVVLGASIPVLLCSYHYLVRPTWLGAILNGRRYPIGRRATCVAGTSVTSAA